jgi:hypothetical protein
VAHQRQSYGPVLLKSGTVAGRRIDGLAILSRKDAHLAHLASSSPGIGAAQPNESFGDLAPSHRAAWIAMSLILGSPLWSPPSKFKRPAVRNDRRSPGLPNRESLPGAHFERPSTSSAAAASALARSDLVHCGVLFVRNLQRHAGLNRQGRGLEPGQRAGRAGAPAVRIS